MDPYNCILKRRSIRKYTQQTIPDQLLTELLLAGMNAPSAGNEQPWQFIIINDHTLLKKIPTFHPHSHMLIEAQQAILVCADTTLETHKGYYPLDCSAATQNILLAAHAKKLGACWLGIYPREERIIGMRKLLNIPQHIIPFALISLGYPREKKETSHPYNKSRVHYNIWEGNISE